MKKQGNQKGTGPKSGQADEPQPNPAEEQARDTSEHEPDEDSCMLCTPNVTPDMSSAERYFRLGQACEQFHALLFMALDGWLLEELKKWDKGNRPRLAKEVLRQAIEWTCGEWPDDDD